MKVCSDVLRVFSPYKITLSDPRGSGRLLGGGQTKAAIVKDRSDMVGQQGPLDPANRDWAKGEKVSISMDYSAVGKEPRRP